jgi:hypothetical protein
VIAFTGILATSYLLDRPRQSEFEQRAMGQIVSWLRLYEAMFPGSQVTNLSQLFGEVSNGYPYFLHEQFRMFDKHAGFDHSISEKYVFLDPPLIAHGCPIVLLSARPYPGDRGFARYALCKAGDGYQIGPWQETLIRRHFRDAKRSIPQPVPAAKPAAPSSDRFGRAQSFWQAMNISLSRLEWRGVPAEQLPAIKWGVVALVWLLILAALAFAFSPTVVIDRPRTEPLEALFTEKDKIIQVTIWTVILTVLTTLWAMMPTIGDNETLYHIAFPYWMIAYHWLGKGAGWMLIPLVLQFPVYGWVVARAWKEDRLSGGVAVVTCAHVSAMLLSAFMTMAR